MPVARRGWCTRVGGVVKGGGMVGWDCGGFWRPGGGGGSNTQGGCGAGESLYSTDRGWPRQTPRIFGTSSRVPESQSPTCISCRTARARGGKPRLGPWRLCTTGLAGTLQAADRQRRWAGARTRARSTRGANSGRPRWSCGARRLSCSSSSIRAAPSPKKWGLWRREACGRSPSCGP